MTHKRIKYEKAHIERFPFRNLDQEPVNNFCYVGYSCTFLFRLPHVPYRYIQRVRGDIHAKLREDLDICMIIAHSLEETELPKIKEGEEYHTLVDLHIHPERPDRDTIHFGEFFIPLKRSKLTGHLVVPTILNKEEREAYLLRRQEENNRAARKK